MDASRLDERTIFTRGTRPRHWLIFCDTNADVRSVAIAIFFELFCLRIQLQCGDLGCSDRPLSLTCVRLVHTMFDNIKTSRLP